MDLLKAIPFILIYSLCVMQYMYSIGIILCIKSSRYNIENIDRFNVIISIITVYLIYANIASMSLGDVSTSKEIVTLLYTNIPLNITVTISSITFITDVIYLRIVKNKPTLA